MRIAISIVLLTASFMALSILLNALSVPKGYNVAVTSLGRAIVATLVFWLIARWIDRRFFHQYGFNLSAEWWYDTAFGLVLGLGMMTTIFGIEYAFGWVKVEGFFVSNSDRYGFALSAVLSLVLFSAAGYFEELVMRGYLIKNLAEGLNFPRWGPRAGIVAAVIISNMLFGLAHMGNPNASMASTSSIFLAGVMLALPYIMTGRLGLSIGLHISWNFCQGVVFGFPVSGIQSLLPGKMLVLSQAGPDLWTGGAFGPEGGLMSVVMILVGSICIVLFTKHRENRLPLFLQIAAAPNQLEPKADEAGVPV